MTDLNSPKYKHGSFYLRNSKKSISLKIRISDVPNTLKSVQYFELSLTGMPIASHHLWNAFPSKKAFL